VALSACGSGTGATQAPTHPAVTVAAASPCTAAAQAAAARRLGVPASAIARSTFVASSGAPSCRYTARIPDGTTVTVTANIDTAPQAYYRLEREVIEDGQMFSTERESPVPQNVSGLGLTADWFPLEMKLETTDGTRLITIEVAWPGRSVQAREATAEAVAAAYLARPG